MAIEIAKLVLLNQHGEIELNRNLPMTVPDDGVAWLVKGTHSREYNERYRMDPSWGGPVIMRIAKFDAWVLFYGFDANLSWLKAPEGAGRP